MSVSRTALEDSVYLARGVLAPSNAAMVARIRGIVEALGAEIATSAQARDMLGLSRNWRQNILSANELYEILILP